MRLMALSLLLSACALAPIEVRQYENLGVLHTVMLYQDETAVSRECVKRTGGADDNGRPFTATNGCADSQTGTVRIAESASVRDFLHELCHIENAGMRAFCDRVFPGGR